MVTITYSGDYGVVSCQYYDDDQNKWIGFSRLTNVPIGYELIVRLITRGGYNYESATYAGHTYSGSSEVHITIEDTGESTQDIYFTTHEGHTVTFIKKGVGVSGVKRRSVQTWYDADFDYPYAYGATDVVHGVDATFQSGYAFDKIEVRNSGGIIETLTSIPTSPISLTDMAIEIWVYGKQSQVTITVEQPQNGNISPGTGDYDIGSTPTFAVTPNTGYRVKNIKVDGQPVIWRR